MSRFKSYSKSIICTGILGLFFSTAHTQTHTLSKTDSLIRKGMDQTFSCRFDSALQTFDNLIDMYPELPSGYFYRALALQAMMIDFESNERENEFYDLIDRAIEKGKRQIENNENDAWSSFYVGGGYFLKGLSQAKSGKMIAGVLNARKGVGHLNEALDRDSTLYVAHLILGNYDYLTGRYYQHIDWLPGISDNRERGIERLKIAIQRGSLSRWAGVISLGWIAYDMEKYDLALDLFSTGHQHYPESRFFLWALANTYLKMKQYDDAIAIYQQLFTAIQQQTDNTLYNKLILHYQMAFAWMAQQKYENALKHCEIILESHINDRIKDQFGSRMDKTRKIYDRCRKELMSQTDKK